MNEIQQGIIILFSAYSIVSLFYGYIEVKLNNNPYGIARLFGLLGVFVWGDALPIGLFWFSVSILVSVLQDWILFLLTISVFWMIRSGGEIIYWIAEQFAFNHRNKPHTLLFSNFFQKESIWFIYQVFWQLILVISIIFTIYFSAAWLNFKF